MVLRELFDDTGLTDVSVDSHDGVVEFPCIEEWMHTDVREWTLADVLDDDQYALLLKETNVVLQEFVLSDGRVAFQSSAHIVKATKS